MSAVERIKVRGSEVMPGDVIAGRGGAPTVKVKEVRPGNKHSTILVVETYALGRRGDDDRRFIDNESIITVIREQKS